MVSFTPRLTSDGIYYGQYAGYLYWDPAYNNYAVNKGWMMANCTCYAFGRALEIGSPAPVSGAWSAYRWNNLTINGWYAIPYNRNNVDAGDILQWGNYYGGDLSHNHVAFVEKVENGVITTSNSNYTSRDTSLTVAQISAYFDSSDYLRRRFFIVSDENYIIGTLPTFILKNPGNPGPGPEPPTPTGDPVQYPIAIGNKWGLKAGDKVKIIGTGRAAADGSGGTAYGLGWVRYIQDVYENGAYPFRVGFRHSNATTGFYKGEALQKIN